jgi:hypothetical protein
MALRKEEANKITFTNDFSERTEREERNQYQQSNDAGCDQLIEGSAADLSEGINDAAAMNEPYDDLFKGIQNEQQSEKRQRLIQCRPNEWQRLESLSNPKNVSQRDELGADERLDGCKAKRCKHNTVRL